MSNEKADCPKVVCDVWFHLHKMQKPTTGDCD